MTQTATEQYHGHWEEITTSAGYTVRVWRNPVPSIPKEYLDCTFYLYDTEDNAKADCNIGGCGFFVTVVDHVRQTSGTPGRDAQAVHHLYAVTNEHNINNGFPIIRVNTTNGGTDTIPLTKDDWTRHPNGDDLSIALIWPDRRHRLRAIYSHTLLDRADTYMAAELGDEVFMVGRFIAADGKQLKAPVLRFGNIAMLPDEPIEVSERGDFLQESYLVDMRSLSGYSGSPVFTYKPVVRSQVWAPTPLPGQGQFETKNTFIRMEDPRLLGVDWGFLNIMAGHQAGLRTMAHSMNSGISGVVPAWKLRELFDDPGVSAMRHAASQAYLEAVEKSPGRLA